MYDNIMYQCIQWYFYVLSVYVYIYTYLLYYYNRVRLLNLLRFVNVVRIRQRVGHTSWYARCFPQIK